MYKKGEFSSLCINFYHDHYSRRSPTVHVMSGVEVFVVSVEPQLHLQSLCLAQPLGTAGLGVDWVWKVQPQPTVKEQQQQRYNNNADRLSFRKFMDKGGGRGAGGGQNNNRNFG